MDDINDYKNNIIFTRDFRKLKSCVWEVVKILKNKVKIMNCAGDYQYLKVGDVILNKKETEHHMKVIQKHKNKGIKQ